MGLRYSSWEKHQRGGMVREKYKAVVPYMVCKRVTTMDKSNVDGAEAAGVGEDTEEAMEASGLREW